MKNDLKELKEQLRECPFCQRQPELRWNPYGDAFHVVCDNIALKLGETECSTHQITARKNFNSEADAIMAAIKKWNRRQL